MSCTCRLPGRSGAAEATTLPSAEQPAGHEEGVPSGREGAGPWLAARLPPAECSEHAVLGPHASVGTSCLAGSSRGQVARTSAKVGAGGDGQSLDDACAAKAQAAPGAATEEGTPAERTRERTVADGAVGGTGGGTKAEDGSSCSPLTHVDTPDKGHAGGTTGMPTPAGGPPLGPCGVDNVGGTCSCTGERYIMPCFTHVGTSRTGDRAPGGPSASLVTSRTPREPEGALVGGVGTATKDACTHALGEVWVVRTSLERECTSQLSPSQPTPSPASPPPKHASATSAARDGAASGAEEEAEHEEAGSTARASRGSRGGSSGVMCSSM